MSVLRKLIISGNECNDEQVLSTDNSCDLTSSFNVTGPPPDSDASVGGSDDIAHVIEGIVRAEPDKKLDDGTLDTIYDLHVQVATEVWTQVHVTGFGFTREIVEIQGKR